MIYSNDLIAKAAAELSKGGLVAFPTETVYGLGADARNASAIAKLYNLKGRPADHPSIVHLADLEELPQWVDMDCLPSITYKLAEHFWPGPMTLILPKHPDVLDQVTGAQASVGVRIPVHPLTRQLIRTFGHGIVGPSANKFGHISPTCAEDVHKEFPDLEYILDGGPCSVGVESTIIDLAHGEVKILRPGMLNAELISNFLQFHVKFGTGVKAPGTLKKHYAPHTRSQIFERENLTDLLKNIPSAVILGFAHNFELPNRNVKWLTMPQEADAYARSLYSALRYADAMHTDFILIERVPNSIEWEAVRDRISRATAT